MAQKNRAASKLSKLAHSSMTPAERTARARKAVAARWGKTKPASTDPQRWFGVCLIPVPQDFHGGIRALTKILDDSQAKPNVVLWTRDRDEARARARQENLDGKWAEVLDMEYNPTRFTIQREFHPDVGRQLSGLRAVLDPEEEGGRS